MPSVYWVHTAASATSWATGANWSSGSAPANGDDVYILGGASIISSGLAQSAVALNSLTVSTGFTGSVGESAINGAYLDIGAAAFRAVQAFSGSGFVSGGFTRFKWNPGATPFTATIDATGTSADSGFGALRIKGGDTTSSVVVNGGSVDLATRPGETASVNSVKVSGGVFTSGAGVTYGGSSPAVTQSGGTAYLNWASSLATLTQHAGTLWTYGTGTVATGTFAGTAYICHRPTGDGFTTAFIARGSGKVYFDEDPRTFKFTTAPQLYKGAMVQAFDKSQLKLTGGASLQLALKQCGIEDVTLNLGADDWTVTLA